MGAGGVEGGVADDAQAAEVEDGGRAAHHHGRALPPRDHALTLRPPARRRFPHGAPLRAARADSSS